MQTINKIYNVVLGRLTQNNSKLFFASEVLLSITALSMAYFFEYLGFRPCPLCLYARFPYFFIIFVGLVALAFAKLRNILLILLIITHLASTCLAAYHSAIELGWALPLDTCKSKAHFAFLSLEEIKGQLESGQIQMPDCSKPALLILGLSMAQLNFLLNGFLAVISLIIFQKRLYAESQSKITIH